MTAHKKTKLKEWWKNCPNKKLVNIFLVGLAVYCIYQLGYGIGTFLAYIGF